MEWWEQELGCLADGQTGAKRWKQCTRSFWKLECERKQELENTVRGIFLLLFLSF